ncbi:hypothetical protein [Coleofasciculus sp.]
MLRLGAGGAGRWVRGLPMNNQHKTNDSTIANVLLKNNKESP